MNPEALAVSYGGDEDDLGRRVGGGREINSAETPDAGGSRGEKRQVSQDGQLAGSLPLPGQGQAVVSTQGTIMISQVGTF